MSVPLQRYIRPFGPRLKLEKQPLFDTLSWTANYMKPFSLAPKTVQPGIYKIIPSVSLSILLQMTQPYLLKMMLNQ